MELGYKQLQERQGFTDKLRDFYWQHEGDINGALLMGFLGAVMASGAMFVIVIGG